MSDAPLDRLREVFLAAAPLQGQAREECLDRLCAGDDGLRAKALELLASDTRAISGIGQSVAWLANSLAETPMAELPLAGARLGPYLIVRELGSGGSGTVFEALQQEPVRRRVAIKFLHRERPLSADRARFRAEQQILANLDHPHIASILDAGTTAAGVAYFVLELVDGTPLTEHASAHGLRLDERLRLCLQACRAAEHAHAKGVIHRDLKPSNILVSRAADGDRVKVIDFGIARLIESGPAPVTREGLHIGTPAYMSPEQVVGKSAECDVKTDVHALGNLIQEVTCGRGVYAIDGLSVSAQLRMVAVGKRDLADRDAHGRRLPGDLQCIIAMATDPEPGRRYATAAALADDVERFLRHLPVAARRSGPAYLLRKAARRHPFAAALAAMLVLIVIGSVAVLARTSERERVAALRARQGAERTEKLATYLQGVMTHADPANLGPQASLGDGLTESARRASLELADDPDLLVRVLATIADVQVRLGSSELALDTLDRAESALAVASAVPAGQVLDLRLLRARSWRQMDRVAIADSLVEGVLAAAHGRKDLARQEAAAWVWRAEGHGRGSSPAAGDSAAVRALELLALCADARREDISAAVRARALCLAEMGQNVRAREMLRGEVAACEAELGPSHLETLRDLSALAHVGSQDVDGESLAIARDVLGRAQRALPADHLELALYENNLAAMLMERGQAGEARPHLERALAVWRRRLGESHPSTTICLNNLGFLSHILGDLAGAERCYRQALAGMEQGEQGTASVQALNTRANLGATLLVGGRPQAAEAVLRAGLDRMSPEQAVHRFAGASLQVLGVALLEQGRRDESAVALQRALDIIAGCEDPDERSLCFCSNSLGLALLGADRPRALAHLKRAEAWMLGESEDRHLRLFMLEQSARLLEEHGLPSRAARYAARARELKASRDL